MAEQLTQDELQDALATMQAADGEPEPNHSDEPSPASLTQATGEELRRELPKELQLAKPDKIPEGNAEQESPSNEGGPSQEAPSGPTVIPPFVMEAPETTESDNNEASNTSGFFSKVGRAMTAPFRWAWGAFESTTKWVGNTGRNAAKWAWNTATAPFRWLWGKLTG